MNPTPAEIENGISSEPQRHHAAHGAKGTPVKTSAASRTPPKVTYSSAEDQQQRHGTTIISRSRARSRCSNWPPKRT